MKLFIAFVVFLLLGFTFAHPSVWISGGGIASPKQFPYQVGLRLIPKKDKILFCGGTLITETFVLTSAQCTKDVKKIKVLLGDIRRKETFKGGRRTLIVDQKNVIVHERYEEKEYLNDIALIKLPVSVKFSEYIKPASLPKNDDNEYEAVNATASGWGYTSDENKLMDKLRYVNVRVIANSVCKIYYKGIVLPSNICVDFYLNKTTCTGDTGGPLVWTVRNMTLIGIASFGTPNCEQDSPAVFTRVTSYLDWIREKTNLP